MSLSGKDINKPINKMQISVASTEWLFAPLFPGRIGIWECCFYRGRKSEYTEKNPWCRDENQQQTQPTYGVNTRNQTRATLLGGECSHHCGIPAPHSLEGRGGGAVLQTTVPQNS